MKFREKVLLLRRLSEKNDAYIEKHGFSSRDLTDEIDRLGAEVEQLILDAIPKLSCCPRALETPVVVLRRQRKSLKSKEAEPYWGARAEEDRIKLDRYSPVEVKYCPFCATPVPKLRMKDPFPADVCYYEDGGYECLSCHEAECICMPPEAAYEIVPEFEPPKRLRRNMRDPESRKFWEETERVAAEVKKWPAWKRGL